MGSRRKREGGRGREREREQKREERRKARRSRKSWTRDEDGWRITLNKTQNTAHNTQLVNKPPLLVTRSSTSRPDVAAMTKTDFP